MADRVLFEVQGLRELGEAFRAIGADMQVRAARSATGAAATPIKRRAITNIRSSPSVETGALAKSVIVKRLPKNQTPQDTSEHIVTVRGRGKKLKSGRVQDSAPYASKVEFGTVHMPAEPFLRPALDAGKGEAVEAMKKSLARSIKRAEDGKP
jgi:HK97 gp10 family phage protein